LILLDTNICIYLINQRPASVLERFQNLSTGDLGVSSVVAAELAYGIEKTNSERNKRALELFLAPLEIAPFNRECIWIYGQVRTHLEGQGTPIGSLDAMIAAHALALNATLVTNNVREFSRVPNLVVENWV
jgi:tRNA(fMet)-specific endonuclease VapC